MKLSLKVFAIPFLSLVTTSCSLTNDIPLSSRPQNPIIGAIVVSDNVILNTSELKGNVKMSTGITLAVKEKNFSNRLFKKYQKSEENKDNGISTDGSSSVLKYIELEVADDIALAATINNNSSLHNYISHNAGRTKVVTKILIVDKDFVYSPESIYKMEQSETGAVMIVSYSETKKQFGYLLSQNTIFQYETSIFCWGINDKGEDQIMDIVEDGASCNGTLSRKLKRNKNKNLYKY